MFFHMAEYCDTLQSKEKRNWENKACLNERAILRLLDQDLLNDRDITHPCFKMSDRAVHIAGQSV